MVKWVDFPISKNDTTILKGVSIMAIVLHNWCHMLPVSPFLENERGFSIHNALTFWTNVFHGKHIIENIFSFYGWHFIYVFIFLSGYGLYSKYRINYDITDVFRSIRKFWILIFPSYLFSVLIKTLIEYGDGITFHMKFYYIFTCYFNSFVQQILFVNNLIYKNIELGSYGLYGPWWFFSLMIQFYLFYYLCTRIFRKYAALCVVKHKLLMYCILISLLFQFLLCKSTSLSNYLIYTRINFWGWIMPFILGVLLAHFKRIPISSFYLFTSLSLFLMGDFCEVLWLLQPFFFLYVVIYIWHYTKNNHPIAGYIGRLSPCIFVVHPIIREYYMENMTISTLIMYLTFSFLSAFVLDFMIRNYNMLKNDC